MSILEEAISSLPRSFVGFLDCGTTGFVDEYAM
jgi:hypothetical protein